MFTNLDNWVRLDDIVGEIEAWASYDSTTDSDSDESLEYESRKETAEELIQGIEEVRRLADESVWYHQSELSFRSSLVHDVLMFGTSENFGSNINEHAHHYFTQDLFRSINLDWLYTNLLIAYSFQRHRDNKESLAADICGGLFYRGTLELVDGRFMSGALLILGWIARCIVQIALVLLPLAAADSQYLYPTMIISSATIATILVSRNRLNSMYLSLKRKTLEDLESIARVYALASRKRVQWEILEEELASTRRQGIMWLTSLFIVARNRHSS